MEIRVAPLALSDSGCTHRITRNINQPMSIPIGGRTAVSAEMASTPSSRSLSFHLSGPIPKLEETREPSAQIHVGSQRLFLTDCSGSSVCPRYHLTRAPASVIHPTQPPTVAIPQVAAPISKRDSEACGLGVSNKTGRLHPKQCLFSVLQHACCNRAKDQLFCGRPSLHDLVPVRGLDLDLLGRFRRGGATCRMKSWTFMPSGASPEIAVVTLSWKAPSGPSLPRIP